MPKASTPAPTKARAWPAPLALRPAASGGHLASWGEGLGSWVYDMTHGEYNPNAPTHEGGASGSW
jgi:hypothetical protein